MPLDTEVQADLGPRFGVDLTDVRIHDGDHAAAFTRLVGGEAATVGRHILMPPAARSSPDHRQLLAHEVAHVIQQDAAPVSPGSDLVPAGPDAEREADRAARTAEPVISRTGRASPGRRTPLRPTT